MSVQIRNLCDDEEALPDVVADADSSQGAGEPDPIGQRKDVTPDDHHRRGLSLANEGIRLGRQDFLERAKVEFETTLELLSITQEIPAFRRRATINLAIVLQTLDQHEDSLGRLESIEDTLTTDSNWLLDIPRGLDALGNAYVGAKRPRDAVRAYQRALAALERMHARGSRGRTFLRGRILINLGAAYVDDNSPEKALTTISEALGLLSQIDDRLDLGRARRVQAEALHCQAGNFYPEGDLGKARNALSRSVVVFEEARRIVRGEGAIAEGANITATLAGTETDLGNLLAEHFPSKQDREEALQRLKRAVFLYTEAFSETRSDIERNQIRLYLGKTLRSLIDRSPLPEDAWLSLSAGMQIYGVQFVDLEFRPILNDIIRIISLGESKKFDYFEVMEKKAARARAFAEDEHLSDEQLREAVDNWNAANGKLTAREIASAEPCSGTAPFIETLSPQVVGLMADKTLLRLQRRYQERLASIELPPDGFATEEQAKAGGRLATTYRDLRSRQIERGLKPESKDSRVVEAERLKEAYYRNAQKKAPARPSRRHRAGRLNL